MINKKISTEQVGYAVESAISLLGNAFAHMSMLHHQGVLKEYNKSYQHLLRGEKQRFLRLLQNCLDPSFSVMPLSTLTNCSTAEGKDFKHQHWQLVGFSKALLLPPQLSRSVVTL